MPQTKYRAVWRPGPRLPGIRRSPIDLVIASSFISHVELFWTVPEAKAWLDQLASFCRVLWFDKAGVGLSDPVPKVRTLEDHAEEIEAIMDAAGMAAPP